MKIAHFHNRTRRAQRTRSGRGRKGKQPEVWHGFSVFPVYFVSAFSWCPLRSLCPLWFFRSRTATGDEGRRLRAADGGDRPGADCLQAGAGDAAGAPVRPVPALCARGQPVPLSGRSHPRQPAGSRRSYSAGLAAGRGPGPTLQLSLPGVRRAGEPPAASTGWPASPGPGPDLARVYAGPADELWRPGAGGCNAGITCPPLRTETYLSS